MTWSRQDKKQAAVNIIFLFAGVPMIIVMIWVIIDILTGG